MKKIRLSSWAIIIIFLFNFTVIFSNHYWTRPSKIFTWDVLEYYSYLPAAFVYHDVELKMIRPGSTDMKDKFWPYVSPINKNVLRMSMGMSVMYSPFFFAAHNVAKFFGYETGGFSEPYKFAIAFSSLIYLVLGLILLRIFLKKYFEDKFIALSLLFVGLGTNILYYTCIRTGMSHIATFFMFAILLIAIRKWYQKPGVLISIAIGASIGLISLIRPSNLIIVLVFTLFGIITIRDFFERIKELFRKTHLLIIIAVFAFAVWIPQLLYWKLTTGQYLYYSYPPDEVFFFNNPQLFRAVLSFRNGWLIYTPMMIFGVAGLFLMKKRIPELFLPVLFYFLINTFIVTSWWCWWYNGFGNRAFIDSYAILIIPFAVFTEWIYKKSKKVVLTFITIAVLFTGLNIFQTYQYFKGWIGYDSMTWKAYKFLFLNTNPRDRFWNLLAKPDYEKAKKGEFATIPIEMDKK